MSRVLFMAPVMEASTANGSHSSEALSPASYSPTIKTEGPEDWRRMMLERRPDLLPRYARILAEVEDGYRRGNNCFDVCWHLSLCSHSLFARCFKAEPVYCTNNCPSNYIPFTLEKEDEGLADAPIAA